MTAFVAHNGIALPSFMYGTAWKKEATAELVKLAVCSGFTAIDTANQLRHYDEARVGEALASLASQGVPRERLFLQTKFTSVGGQGDSTPYDRGADIATQVQQSFASSLAHLGLDTIDSYILHAPCTRDGLVDADWQVWSVLEDLYRQKRVRMIGVSNFSPDQLTELCQNAGVKPMVVQNRCYAMRGWDHAVRAVCRNHGIIYQGFSLLTANLHILAAPPITGLAERYNTGPAQIIFRFAMQLGILPLTGTSRETHMREDLSVHGFTLSPEEVEMIERLGLG